MTMAMNDQPHHLAAMRIPAGWLSATGPLLFGLLISGFIWFKATTLSTDARVVLIVTVLAIIGWVATKLPDSLVALLAALALVITGAQPQSALTDTLGSQIVWLLLAAFVIAAVIKEGGLAERLVAPLTRQAPRVLPFFLLTGAAISATAFFLPSTSGRAALLLPVFIGLLASLPDSRLAKPLALLFPSAILLSAGGALIGAGAHVIAVEAIVATGGPRLGYLDWMLIGAPLALLSVGAAALLIFVLFVPHDLRSARLIPSSSTGELNKRQRRILFVLVALVVLWVAKPLHGLDETIVALGGAVLLLFPPFCARKTKDVFRSVDVELVLYMAATLMLSVAVIDTGLDRWLAQNALRLLPEGFAANSLAVVLFLSIVAVASHLAITSRSARAAILVPALAIPMAGLGHDATLTILIAVMGSGFCQTMMASAKPVAIFGASEEAGFTQKDLARLALPLAPIKVALLAAFALWVWPDQLARQVAEPDQKSQTLAASMTIPSVATIAGMPSTGSAQDSPFASGLAPEQRNALSSMAMQASAQAVAVSPRPLARPTFGTPARANPTKRASEPPRRPDTVADQIQRDLRQAGKDLRSARRKIERDLARLFR